MKLKDFEYLNILLICNYGTTFHTGFDDIPALKQFLNDFKNPSWNINIHVDGAFYGAAWSVLKHFNIDINEINTLAISMYKLLGSPIVSGIALANKSFLEQGIINTSNYVEYSQIYD